MGQALLVDSQITDSISVIQKLDATGNPPSFAMWYYYPDADEWRLIVAGKTFDALLPKQEAVAYRKIVDVMSATALAGLGVSQIKLVRTDDVLPRALKRLVGTPPDGIGRAHFTDTTLSGIFIKEMVILRSA